MPHLPYTNMFRCTYALLYVGTHTSLLPSFPKSFSYLNLEQVILIIIGLIGVLHIGSYLGPILTIVCVYLLPMNNHQSACVFIITKFVLANTVVHAVVHCPLLVYKQLFLYTF